jgi:hypothetical protein
MSTYKIVVCRLGGNTSQARQRFASRRGRGCLAGICSKQMLGVVQNVVDAQGLVVREGCDFIVEALTLFAVPNARHGKNSILLCGD